MTASENIAVVSGDFDDLRSQHVRFLQKAARLTDIDFDLCEDSKC